MVEDGGGWEAGVGWGIGEGAVRSFSMEGVFTKRRRALGSFTRPGGF